MKLALSVLVIVSPLVLISCATVTTVSMPKNLQDLPERINVAVRDAPHLTQVERIERELARSSLGDFYSEQLRGWATRDLRLAMTGYESAVYMSSGALARPVLDTMERIVSELDRRGEDPSDAVRKLHRSYIQTRSFEDARRLAERYPNVSGIETFSILLSPLPTIRNPIAEPTSANIRRIWRVSVDGKLSTTGVTIPMGVVVVAIVGPNCHFSSRALRAIRADPELAALLSNAILLMPPAQTLDVGAVAEWNRENPGLRFDYVHSVREWPEIEYWDTPQFYFFANRKVVATVTGWPREGRQTALREADLKARAALN